MAESGNTPRRGEVWIDLDGRQRRFRFNMNVLAGLQDLGGPDTTPEQAVRLIQTPKGLIRALWECFRDDDPSLTERQVGAMLDLQTLKSMTPKIDQAVVDGIGDQPGGKENPVPAASAPAGTGTGQSA